MSDRRRLLVVTYHFPPDRAVGGLRWAGLTKYLAAIGPWEVHVLTAASGSKDAAPPGVVIHQVDRFTTLNDRYRAFVDHRRARKFGAPSVPASSSTGSSEPGTRLAAFRKEASYALVFPDVARGWILQATRAARRLHSQRKLDLIITSGPPHSAHLVGTLSAEAIPHLVDYRDPWEHQLSGDGWEPGHLLQATLEPRLRRFIEARASGIITVTKQFRDELRRQGAGIPVRWLANGIDPERLHGVEPEPASEPVLSYVGSLYHGRDLGPILQALATLLARSSNPAVHRLVLKIAGPMEEEHRSRFNHQLRTYDLESRVDLLGSLPRAQALDVVRQSWLSLVLAQKQSLQIPAKLYESMGIGVTTLVLAEEASASFDEARRIGALACEPGDIAGIASILERVATGTLPVRRGEAKPIGHPFLAERLHAILEESIGGAASEQDRGLAAQDARHK